MRVGAIITEYNPFHNGHKYQIETFKKESNLDYIIVIMSGNFTQRGEPAWMPKHSRTKMALLGGADLVIELPLYYATGSAALFAYGAIAHLNALGCVDELCFGCESENSFDDLINSLNGASSILANEPTEYKKYLNYFLQQGLSFPSAREKALTSTMNDACGLFSPNNILALEYMTALKKTHSSIVPKPMIRKGPGYHSLEIEETFASASSIRHQLNEQTLPDAIHGVPETSREIMKSNLFYNYPITLNDFSLLLGQAYLFNQDRLTEFIDINEDIANRMHKFFDTFTNLENYLSDLKTKSLTHTRLSRCMIHLLTGQSKEKFKNDTKNGYAHYARVLGFRKKSSGLLHYIKRESSIPLITKMASYKEVLNEDGVSMIESDIYASNLYRTVIQNKYGNTLKNEFTEQIVII